MNRQSSAWSGERPRHAADRARRQSHPPVHEKQPPHSVEGEQGVLGSIFQSAGKVFPECFEKIQPEFFYVPAHRTLYIELRDVWESGKEIDLIAFTQRLRDKNILGSLGGAALVTSLFTFVPTAANVGYYLDIVVEKYILRETIAACTEGIRRALEPEASDEGRADSLLSELESSIESIRSLQGINGAMPQIEDAASEIAKQIDLPSDVIEGVLHRGGKLVCGGASKSYKTWLLIDLSISVASGAEWFNGYPTKQGRVLYLNLELPAAFFKKRIQTVCDERQITLKPRMLDIWNLRGYAMRWPEIRRRIRSDVYILIIIDPIYKILLGRAENKTEDIAIMMNELEELAVHKGAAVAFGAHYSKGNQALKESIDRISGSGVFSRDPDSILSFTKHEEKDCFTVEMTLRNHPPRKPLVVRWEHPLFIPENTLDPTKLKHVGRPPLHSANDVLLLIDEPMFAKEILKAAWDEHNIPRRCVFDYLASLKRDGLIRQPQRRGKYERV